MFTSHRRLHLMSTLVLLTIVFVLFQIIILAYSDISYILLKCAAHKHLVIPLSVWVGSLFYLFAQLVLYLLLIVTVWSVAILNARLVKYFANRGWQLGVFLWSLSVIGLLLANQVYFPASFFSTILNVLIPDGVAEFILYGIVGILSVFVILAVFAFLRLMSQSDLVKVVVGGCLCVGALFFISHAKQQSIAHPSSQPNIIIIGIDDVRPDYIGLYGNKRHLTPSLDKFLQQAVNFKLSITPFARTFPAWSSVLTGQYPKHNHIRFNLIDQSALKLDKTLPAILRKQGYYTAYATDDRRFSDIGKNFGFDQLIGVQAGVNELLLATLNDFPITNLVVNTFFGQYLFPYSYANREAPLTYRPETFVRLVQAKLKHIKQRPIFLSVHFCLPHWPFYWAGMHLDPNMMNLGAYTKTVKRVDQQFGNFINMLQRRGLLNNAIVIVLSDHGEAFAERGDRLITKSGFVRGRHSRKNILKQVMALGTKKEVLDAAFSHGSDVLSFVQHHQILAFRRYGEKTWADNNINDMASLIDIKPTVLSILNLTSPDTDGISLLPYLQNKNYHQQRLFFAESGFMPTSVNSTKISVQNAVYDGADIFRIDPKTAKIIMRPDMVKKLLKVKQGAVFYRDWVLAFYPSENNQLISILVNRKTGKWTDDLSTGFAQRAPLKRLLSAMKRFYGDEVGL